MFSQYFGQFLLNKSFITREQLADALEFQQSVHVKFGVIAIEEGYMTPLQVEEVHEKQKQVDKRFGEIAVELGFLTDEQVQLLLSNQKQSHLFLAQALVDRGYMTIQQFSDALETYKKENSLSDEHFEAMKNGNIEKLITNTLDHAGNEKFGKYVTLFAKNMIRFIDDQAYIEVSQEKDLENDWLVYQNIIGENPLFTAISASEDVFLTIASIHAEEELTEVDELAQASVAEFLNLHNGIYLVNMSNWGTELHMRPQEVVKDATVLGESYKISVHTQRGVFHLILSDRPEQITLNPSMDSELV
ncbi:CheY-specific phosphatase CheX [Natronobacillus azotifigens]|uniref:Chemotaxis protein CheX n=1 Tax=Natronobacillus azotifigens TaxID=472978 RepID=A0A9J6R9F9_9BACI|nr:hypothetical protein [Natronobacillus azotifigens]MCZ0702314.1 hypothetical protein [Natronobacillus azotifigens]